MHDPTVRGNPPHATQLRILLVEADPDWRMLAELHLRLSARFELVRSAGGLSEGIDAVAELAPDVVLVGLGLPMPDERSELALLRAIRGDARIILASSRLLESTDRTADVIYLDKMCIVDLERELTVVLDDAPLCVTQPA